MSFGLAEAYNAGWSGTAMAVGDGGDDPLTPGSLMSALMAHGVLAGAPMNLTLTVSGSALDGSVARTWPCMVQSLSPFPITESRAGCRIRLVDPLGYLAEQPIWGAYRGASAVEVVGGALSLAAGGDGKPTTRPVLPGLPPIRVVADYREALGRIPYVIAAGQPLGDWLVELLGMLGLRAELRGYRDGRLRVTLSDRKPGRGPLNMSVVTPAGTVRGSASDTYGPIRLVGHSAFPAGGLRGALLDDPAKGSPRPLVARGAVGTVLNGMDLDLEEAAGRLYREARGNRAEMVMLTAMSRQPRLRPGELVRLSVRTHGLADWQVSSVNHSLGSARYDNDITLIRGDVSWHPDLPLHRPPVYVSAMVNGGNHFDYHEPVPRDRLGRIKVTFPFSPTPTGAEARELAVVDSDRDGRVNLDDFDEEEVGVFEDDTVDWEEEKRKYDAGDYNDPFPRKADSQLTVPERARRDAMEAKRERVIGYRVYSRAKRDRDADGVISERDKLISDDLSTALQDDARRSRIKKHWAERDGLMSTELSEALKDDRRRREIERQWTERDETPVPEGSLAAEYGELFGHYDDHERAREVAKQLDERDTIPLADRKLAAEYGELIAHHDDESEAGLSPEAIAARDDAEAEADRWPPRVPLPVVAPMAGALHGFMVAHRHGDTCRVAVHSPFHAEIVGFQYREDRRINADLSGSVAGLVVEHNYGDAWSGLVFRRTEDLEDARKPLPEPGTPAAGSGSGSASGTSSGSGSSRGTSSGSGSSRGTSSGSGSSRGTSSGSGSSRGTSSGSGSSRGTSSGSGSSRGTSSGSGSSRGTSSGQRPPGAPPPQAPPSRRPPSQRPPSQSPPPEEPPEGPPSGSPPPE